jgi:hypothetical protein
MQREREGGKVEVKRESPAGDRARSVKRKRSLVFRVKAAIECDIEARQRARGRKEWRRSMSDGKGKEGKLKERGNGSKIKKERQKHTKSE